MKVKYPLAVRTESGDKTVNPSLIIVPDAAITEGTNQVTLDSTTIGGDALSITIGTDGQYATIMEAMAAITDAAVDNIYTLDLLSSYKRAPHQYDTFQWKPYVQISAPRLNQRQNLPAGVDGYGGFNFDRAFQGVDFTLCAAESPAWMPFQQYFAGMILNSVDANYQIYPDIASMLAGSAEQGAIVLVLDDGDGQAAMFILQGTDPSTFGDWVNVTTDCTDVSFVGCEFPFLSALGTIFTSAHFNYANCTSANFDYANCTSANFGRANCTGTSFGSANCTSANFGYANCTSANFQSADLTDANLTGMLADGANFTSATMPDNADTKAEFKALVGSWNAVTTIWTDGNPIG